MSEKQIDTNSTAVADEKPIIEINGMHKWYGEFHVLRDINLKVQPQ